MRSRSRYVSSSADLFWLYQFHLRASPAMPEPRKTIAISGSLCHRRSVSWMITLLSPGIYYQTDKKKEANLVLVLLGRRYIALDLKAKTAYNVFPSDLQAKGRILRAVTCL